MCTRGQLTRRPRWLAHCLSMRGETARLAVLAIAQAAILYVEAAPTRAGTAKLPERMGALTKNLIRNLSNQRSTISTTK